MNVCEQNSIQNFLASTSLPQFLISLIIVENLTFQGINENVMRTFLLKQANSVLSLFDF